MGFFVSILILLSSMLSFCRVRTMCAMCVHVCQLWHSVLYATFFICGLHATICMPYNRGEFIQWTWKHAVNIRRAHVLPGLNSKWSNSFWIMESTDVEPITNNATQLYEKSTLILRLNCVTPFLSNTGALFIMSAKLTVLTSSTSSKTAVYIHKYPIFVNFFTVKIWNESESRKIVSADFEDFSGKMNRLYGISDCSIFSLSNSEKNWYFCVWTLADIVWAQN